MDSDSSSIPMKQCYHCKQFFPATPQYFRINNTKKGGLEARCKMCYKIKKPLLPPVHEGNKRCTKCLYEFPATSEYFYHDNATKDTFCFRCKQCMKEGHDTAAYHEMSRVAGRKHYHSHLEQNHARNNAYYKRLRQEDPEHARRLDRTKRRNRRASKASVAGKHTEQQVQEQYKRQKGKCYFCQKKVKWGEHHVEHTFPLKRIAGTDIPGNSIDYLVISCGPCNKKKGPRFPWEYPEGNRLL